MALLNLRFNAYSLSMSTAVNVILPERIRAASGPGEKRPGPIKALYLLHGMSGDESDWCRQTAIERYAADHNLAVIMPTTGLYWYTDLAAGQKWFTYVSRELPEKIHEFLPQISTEPEHTFAAGLSMGGYGALKLGLCGDGRFSRVAALSGAVDIARDHDNADPENAAFFRSIFGTDKEATGTFDDLMTAAETLSAEKRPKVYMWCGTEDFLLEQNRRMRARLDALGYDLTYEESPGDHQWKYWDERIQAVLKWLPLQ